jgi:hypothetical protein
LAPRNYHNKIKTLYIRKWGWSIKLSIMPGPASYISDEKVKLQENGKSTIIEIKLHHKRK